MTTPEIILERRRTTEERLERLKQELHRTDAHSIVANRACVYATGSGGRGEMSSRSDLDIFIVVDKSAAPSLNRLEEIRLKRLSGTWNGEAAM